MCTIKVSFLKKSPNLGNFFRIVAHETLHTWRTNLLHTLAHKIVPSAGLNFSVYRALYMAHIKIYGGVPIKKTPKIGKKPQKGAPSVSAPLKGTFSAGVNGKFVRQDAEISCAKMRKFCKKHKNFGIFGNLRI